MNEKTCTKCNQTFPATKEYFHAKKSGKYGLKAKCKPCHIETVKLWCEENKEARAEYKKQWYEENKDVITTRKKRYYEENKEAMLEYCRQYRIENKEALAEYDRQRVRKYNPERIRVLNARYRARKNNLPDTFTPDEWDYCLAYFNYTCPACDNQLRDLFGNVEPHADHWIPISYDGDDNPGTVAKNMVCLCNGCNCSKGAKLPGEWLKQTYGTRKANEILARIEAYFDHVSPNDQQTIA